MQYEWLVVSWVNGPPCGLRTLRVLAQAFHA
jgi:hypothetical protein